MPKRLTTEEFIKKATAIHGDTYDYSEVDYQKTDLKVKIYCPKHGYFLLRPNDHLSGYGCQKCGLERKATKRMHTKDRFVEGAREVHGDRYDYSAAVYERSDIKVEIICPIHGSFWQAPATHKCGIGCPQCGFKKSAEYRRSDTETFIEKARRVHWDREYDYSLVKYEHNKKKVEIICPEHGVFLMKPNSILVGQGCPVCGLKYHNKEIRVGKILKSVVRGKMYKVDREFSHPSLVAKKNLRFDFAVIVDGSNWPMFIVEHQGRQHFEFQNTFSIDLETWERYILHDRIKRLWAEEKHIPLVYTLYCENDEIIRNRFRLIARTTIDVPSVVPPMHEIYNSDSIEKINRAIQIQNQIASKNGGVYGGV